MKKKIFISMSVAIAAMIVLMSATMMTEESAESAMVEKSFVSCPNGPVTLQGCVVEDDGCFTLNTINGRSVAIGIFGQGVGAGDEISITGNWQTDADCAPCLLNATSVTDLGDCN